MNKYEKYLKEKNWGLEFRYMLLDRMRWDCCYFLGYGHGCRKYLWAGTVASQIGCMKALWESLPVDAKPEWLTMEEIISYERQMLAAQREKYLKEAVEYGE